MLLTQLTCSETLRSLLPDIFLILKLCHKQASHVIREAIYASCEDLAQVCDELNNPFLYKLHAGYPVVFLHVDFQCWQ